MTKSPTKTAKLQTPFSEQAGQDRRYWLSNPRWTQVPVGGFPAREFCQAEVTDVERAQGTKLLADYRASEQVARDNDIQYRSDQIRRLEAMGPGLAADVEALRRERGACDHQKFLDAQSNVKRLREECAELAKKILERLVSKADDHLNAVVLEAESRLNDLGIAIFEDNMVEGYQRRTWTLHSDVTCTAWHARREVIRNRLQWIDKLNAGVGEVIYLCTDEDIVFHWLG